MKAEILAEEDPIRIKCCRNGLFMYNVNDRYIGKSLDFYGEFSEGEAELFRQFLRPGMIALDIGANIGVHTVNLAKAVSPGGWVLAYEPQRIVHQMLCGNIALNALDNVSTFNAALGKECGSINVPAVDYRRPGNFGGISMGPAARGETVPLETLDRLKLPQCHFIKIDVEGMEQEVIEGGLETLARCQPVLYVENDRNQKARALIEYLNRAGYRAYWHLTPLFNPANFFGVAEDVFSGVFSFNAICIPQSSSIVLKEFVEITPENADHPPI